MENANMTKVPRLSLSGVPLELGEPVELPGGATGYPSDLVLLTGQELYRKDFGGRFVIDLDSVILGKSNYIGDYDHNHKEVIGHGTLEVTDAGLVGRVFVIPVHDGDRASEVVKRSRAGTPYEASPTIEDESATVEPLAEGQSATVNGVEIVGPIRIYRNLPIRGWSVCPYGTDRNTSFTVLNMSGETMTKKLTDEKIDQPAPGEEGGEENKFTAQPELEKMIAEFGFEAGVNYFRQGISFEEAEKLDYAELKATRLAGLAQEDEEKPETAPEAPVEETEPDDEKKQLAAKTAKLSADPAIKELTATVKELSMTVTRLAARNPGEEPLSASRPVKSGVDPSKLHATQRLALKYASEGITKVAK